MVLSEGHEALAHGVQNLLAIVMEAKSGGPEGNEKLCSAVTQTTASEALQKVVPHTRSVAKVLENL